MTRAEILYLVPYLASLALCLGVLVYVWQRSDVKGGIAFTWYVTGRTILILSFILELISPDISSKIFWDGFQWLVELIGLVAFPVFAVQYAEYKLKNPRRLFALSLVVPVLFAFAVMTDRLHHLIYPNPQLNTDFPFPELTYDFTWVVYGFALYGYVILFWGTGILARRLFRLHDLYRAQTAIVIVGFLIPLVGTIFSLLEIPIAPQRDATPFTAAVGNLIIAWGLFRYGLFDLVPIARERVLENMADQIIVLDVSDRVIDINPAALGVLVKKSSEVIGKPSSMVFSQWSDLVEQFRDINDIRTEVKTVVSGQPVYYDLKISPIYDQRKQLVGRVVVAHDITKRKTLEDGYRKLSEELEKRVQERTEELRKSVERYRAVVENQTEFIVRWKPDGTRTFVNEAYCRYWGISYEHALSINFMSHIAEEDRPAIEKKISRLKSGAINAETEIHRIIKPDGSIGWQEWTDQAIRDEDGQLVEFQSVGRDITERKLAEDALRKSEERFSKAFQESPIIITISQVNDGKLLEVNDAFEKITGYTREEVLERTTIDLGIWVNLADRDRYLRTLRANGKIRNDEIQFRIKSGKIITCLVSSELIELGSEECALAVVEDITERKKAEARILRLNRLYATISQINQTIVHARDTDSLFSEICHVATDHGQFRMAWIGLLDETGEQVKPVVFAGEELGYLANPNIKLHDEILGNGPTGIVIRDGRCIICQDIASDPRMIPWREQALERGYRSLAAVPFREHGRVVGVLTVYASEPQGFDSEDEELLEQIGLDVSFALDSINAETERKRAEENLAEAYDTTLEGWARALELRDKETEGHSRRVTETTLIVARAMGFNEEELVHVRRGSILHDIGKMGIPDDILRKNGPLTEEEKAIVYQHPITAYNLLKPITYLEKALEIPFCHHEKWDGTGYPRGLKGEEIPLTARIFAVVDVWDALSSDRPYRNAWPKEKVVQYLLDESGKHFDPRVVEVFLGLAEKGEI